MKIMSEYKELSCLAYDLRKKVVEMVVSGKGGHIGGDMSVIDVLVALYFKEMNISPKNMDDPDRDRPNSAVRTSAIRTINCRASR